jgi:protoporphyrinogen oxidase
MGKPALNDGVVILGGGLAGLAASLTSGAPVYEADTRVGGVAASDSADGFTFDRGIHVLQTQNARVMSLFDDLGIKLQNHSRRAYIYYRGDYAEYPFQVNTAGLPLGLRLSCVWGFLRRGRQPKPTNYEEWINRSVGRGFARTFLIPYSEKFWTVHPREMTFEWTNNRVPQPSLWQVVRGAFWNKHTAIGSNAEFRYPVDGAGYGSIAKALAAGNTQVHLGHRAARIDTQHRTVHFENGSHVAYDTLVSTIPLPDLIKLCSQAPSAVIDAARQLKTNSIMVVNLGIGRAGVSDKHWVHFPEREFSFFRLSFPNNFSVNVAPAGTSSISAEVAYSDTAPIDKRSIVDRVIDDLKRAGILRRDESIVATATRDIKYAYCIYDKQRTESLRVIHQWLRQERIVPCGRYGLWTYFWSDEAILSGLKAGESLGRQVSARAMQPHPAAASGR